MRHKDEEVTINEMATKFNASYATTQKAMNRLVHFECVQAREVGNTTLYSYPEID